MPPRRKASPPVTLNVNGIPLKQCGTGIKHEMHFWNEILRHRLGPGFHQVQLPHSTTPVESPYPLGPRLICLGK